MNKLFSEGLGISSSFLGKKGGTKGKKAGLKAGLIDNINNTDFGKEWFFDFGKFSRPPSLIFWKFPRPSSLKKWIIIIAAAAAVAAAAAAAAYYY